MYKVVIKEWGMFYLGRFADPSSPGTMQLGGSWTLTLRKSSVGRRRHGQSFSAGGVHSDRGPHFRSG